MLMGPVSLILLIISVYIIQPKVEAKLTSKVRSVLEQHNIDAQVSFSGRDGILKGSVENQAEADNAAKLSLEVFGTRVIRNRLNVKNQHSSQTIVEKTMTPQPVSVDEALHRSPIEGATDTAIVVASTNKAKTTSLVVEKDTRMGGYTSEVDKIMANMQQMNLHKPIAKEPDVKRETTLTTSNKRVVESLTLDKVIVKKVKFELPQPIKAIEVATTKTPKIEPLSAMSKSVESPVVEKKMVIIDEDKEAEKPAKLVKTSKKKSAENDIFDIINDFNASL